MKYIILCDSDNVEPFIEPRQLAIVNGEQLVKRTIRLLKENGVKDILITSHDKRFDDLGAIRYEPKKNSYKGKEQIGYWLDAFPKELLIEPITFLLGDVYFSEQAIKTIVETQTKFIMFFCTDRKLGYNDKYIKHHDEPFGFKVVSHELFKEHIDKVKKMYDEGKTRRHPIAWELYRSINELDVNKHILTTNYTAINDETCDIDRIDDIMLLEIKLGGNCMVKVEVLMDFTLKDFDKIKKSLIRKNPNKNKDGWLYAEDIFECEAEMAKYLTGENAKKVVVVKVLEVKPIEVKPIVDTKAESEFVKPLDEENIKKVASEIEKHITPKATIKKTTKKTTKKSKK